MTATLRGLRVIDAASFLAGPCAATIMSDYGADVIKIEPLTGDGHRRISGGHPIQFAWELTDRNRRGVALDFTREQGRAILLRLIDGADVVLFNLRAEQLERYDLTYATLSRRNPRLIYAQVSGYGLEGAEASRRAFDVTGWFARTGILDVMRDKGRRARAAGRRCRRSRDGYDVVRRDHAGAVPARTDWRRGDGVDVARRHRRVGERTAAAGRAGGTRRDAAARCRGLVESVRQCLHDGGRAPPDGVVGAADAGMAAARCRARTPGVGRGRAFQQLPLRDAPSPRTARVDCVRLRRA